MSLVVKYARFEQYGDLGLGGLKRPYAAVRLQRGGSYLDTIGLIDSGADGSLFHTDFALGLGLSLDPNKAEPMNGVGGEVQCWKFDIHLTVLGKRFPARVAFTSSLRKEFGLLGREDFFRVFAVGFGQAQERVLLK